MTNRAIAMTAKSASDERDGTPTDEALRPQTGERDRALL